MLEGQAQRYGGGKQRRGKPSKDEEELANALIGGAPDLKDAIAAMLKGAKGANK